MNARDLLRSTLRAAPIVLALALAGCAADAAAPPPGAPTVGAVSTLPAPASTPAAAPTTLTPTAVTPPSTAPAPVGASPGVGLGKGPPRAPSGTTPREENEETEIQEVGPMSDTQRAVFRAAARCFEQGVHRGEKPSRGSLSIELTIDESGKVTSADLGPAYPASVKACLEPRLRGIAYPAQAGGGLRIIRYPMNEVAVDESP